MRIDKLLWFLRFVKSRGLAQALVEEGHIRRNGRRVERAHQKVMAGDVLVLPLGPSVRVVEVLAIPVRRGPPSEAQSCYQVLDAPGAFPIAPVQPENAAEGDLQP